jgi:hypothetical protein
MENVIIQGKLKNFFFFFDHKLKNLNMLKK